MKTTKPVYIGFLLLGAIAAILAIVQVPSAQEKKAEKTLAADDRQEILDLISKYSHAWDSRDANALVDLFTEDCIWEAYGDGGTKLLYRFANRRELSKAVKPRLEELKKKGVQSRHYQTNTLLTKTADRKVEAITVLCVMWQLADKDAPQPVDTGVYKDVIVKTERGWRFAKRTTLVDHK